MWTFKIIMKMNNADTIKCSRTDYSQSNFAWRLWNDKKSRHECKVRCSFKFALLLIVFLLMKKHAKKFWLKSIAVTHQILWWQCIKFSFIFISILNVEKFWPKVLVSHKNPILFKIDHFIICFMRKLYSTSACVMFKIESNPHISSTHCG